MEGMIRRPPLSPHWKQDLASPAHSTPISQRRGGDDLPPLAHPDPATSGRRGSSDTQRSGSITQGNMSSLTSPSAGMYPGPPPPYSFHPASTNGTTARNGYISPPDSRDPPGEEKDAGRQQSLPSIHEALGKDHSPLYPPSSSQASALPPPPPPSAPAGYHTQVTASPTQRSYTDPHPPAAQGYHHHVPPYPNESPEAKHHPPYRQGPREEHAAPPRIDTGPHSYSSATSSAPPAAHSPHVIPPPQTSPTYPPPSAQSMAPIPAPAYRNYQPAYSYPPPQANTFAAVNTYPQPRWRPEMPEVDDARKAAQKHSPGTQHYGEAVKRHLDIFDLESSLNEMAEGCGQGLNFARHFGNRAHQNSRSGPTLASLPNLQDCDDMIKRHERVLASLTRIREFVVAQQHAEQQRSHNDSASSQRPTEFGVNVELGSDPNDRDGGFANDAKKRRGRNAPPGRCHSCNRAETPEWRRGPDGARTLCNACGLHYAKLTRKHGAKAGVGNSNLRPKDNGET